MTDVVAEMTATVFRVHVAVGDRVSVDDPVVTLESMKMEIPAVAGVSGTVSRLDVAEGSAVEEGSVLAVIEPDPA
ncbi:biotin/lipoyl-binding carrier protein [Nocardioides albidus]|uniref:Biotin/lipoyl-binding carrier protein n=1 Tax=Nocardioides albidus TaxID=1517589 RepID=A0A5C4VKJ6_9ACTN|nr:biotin/lipoyl-binding carrier protein [Nocardioides albidus]TNM36358.1 biotin/lipoyl-binding carrier protein [Nocardioides albidus]